MNINGWRSFLSGGPGLAATQIQSLCAATGHALPKEYLEMLTVTNGLVFDDGLALYGAEALPEMNEIIDIAVHLPGYVTIGNDSGGREIVTTYQGGKVFWLDQGYVDPDGLIEFHNSLSAWFEEGLPLIKGGRSL